MSAQDQSNASAVPPAPETPINVKREQLRQKFMSPTDNFFSPCTAKLMGIEPHRTVKQRGGLLHQTFKKNMERPSIADQENTPVPREENATEPAN